MKAHSLTFYSVAALLAFNLSSTKESIELPISRMPAAEQVVDASTNVTAVSVVNVHVTLTEQSEKYSNELKQLKIKLVSLEKELADKKQNDQQITEANQKEIADLKLSIKDSEAKLKEIADLKLAMSEAKNKAEEEIQTIQCNSKRHEAKLEEQIQKHLKDKEDILKEFESLKSEIKLSKETKAAPAPVAGTPDQSSNSNLVALMAQITSMLQSQQQMQMQMQMQMFSMFPQTNYNPYAPSAMNNSLSNTLGNYGGYGIGVNGYNLSQNPYAAAAQSPYSMIPMERSQIPFNSGFGLGSNAATPGFSGYDFSNLPATSDRFSPPILAAGQMI